MWEEVRRFYQEGTFLEVRHVTAHLCKKERQEMSLFEHFVSEGNEKADELAKDEAMLDRGEMALKRGGFTQHCSTQPVFTAFLEVLLDCEELKPTP